MPKDTSVKIEIPTSLATMDDDELSDITRQMNSEEDFGKPICFILAKKQSQRLPHKNKLSIGKPLLVRAIETAWASDIFETVVVSSDDMEILEMAYESKALLHKRPHELSTSRIQIRQVMRFLMDVYKCHIFCVLTPCNPFVTAEDLQEGYKMLIDKESHYVLSVRKGKPNPMTVQKDGFITPVLNPLRSQK